MSVRTTTAVAALSLTLGLVLAVLVATASPAHGSPSPFPSPSPLTSPSPASSAEEGAEEDVELREVELTDEDAQLLLTFLILLGLQAELEEMDPPAVPPAGM